MFYQLYVSISLIIFIGIVFKFNIILIIMFLILYLIYIDIEIYFFDRNVFEHKDNYKIINICNNPNTGHLGDNVFNIFYFNFISNYIENNNILIKYHIDKKHHHQIKELNISKNVLILDYKPKGVHFAIMSFNYFNNCLFYGFFKPFYQDKLYIDFFKETSDKLNIPIYMDKIINIDNTLINDYQNLDSKYKDIDILIINSIPFSGQIKININEWDNFIKNLYNNNFKIVTTYKVENIPCTLDDNLTLRKIGAISTRSKIIIGINTSPMTMVYNNITFNYCKIIFYFDEKFKISLPNFKLVNSLSDIDINYLKEIIKNFNETKIL